MATLENHYFTLGLARGATEMEIAQAYRAKVQKLQAAPATDAEHNLLVLQQVELAYQTLLNPEKKKKHDETLAWHDTRKRLDADKALRMAQQRKDEEEAAKEAEAQAKARAAEAARQAAAEAKRLEEEARIHAEAEARFRQLRAERQDFGETQPLPEPDPAQTAPALQTDAAPATAPAGVGRATIAISLAVVVALFGFLLNLQPGAPKAASADAPPPLASASAPAPLASASAPTAAPATSEPAPPTAAAAPKATATTKPTKEDATKTAEAQQFQKALKHMEAEHPELNPRSTAYRADLMAFVNARMQVHTKAGYPKPKALEIAVRDLETQDQIHRAIEQRKNSKEALAPATPPVADKGGHSGFDAKCRWLNAQEWSCK